MTARRRRILVIFSTFGGVLVTGAILIYVLVIPWLVRNRLSAVLRAQGLNEFTFHVPVATLRRAMITDLKIANGDNRIDKLIVHYSPTSISQGRLDTIRIEGMSLVGSVSADGTFNAGPLAPILKKATTQPAATQPSESAILPADRIELESSKLIIKSPKTTTELPLAGTITSSDHLVKLDFKTALGAPLVLAGDYSPKNSATHLTLNADDTDARALTRLIDAFIPGLSIGVSGKLKTQAAYTSEDGKSSVDANFTVSSPAPSPSPTDPNVLLTSGVFHITGTLGEGASGAKGTASLSIKDASLTEHSQTMEVTGITGDLQLASLAPLASPPKQRVHVSQAKIGELALSDGTVEFQVTGPQSIQIQHTQWNTLGGQVLANNAKIENGNVTATLEAQKVDLEQVLNTFAKDKATGKGSISGQIQIAYTKGLLHILSGQLLSSGTGTLVIHNAEDIAGGVAKNLARGPAQEQAKAQLIAALKDFQFTRITGEMTRESTGAVAHFHVLGHGRTGTKVPILYDLNVTGLEPLIRTTLRLREGLSAPHNAQGKAQP
jgi:hypothetical protein